MKKLTIIFLIFISLPCFGQDIKPTPTPELKPTFTPTRIPTPVDWNAEAVSDNTINFYSGDIHYKDSRGAFQKIDNAFQEISTNLDGKKIYKSPKRANPVDVITGATPGIVIRSNRDYAYADRALQINFESAKWGGVKTAISTTADYTQDEKVFEGGDVAIQNEKSYSRIFVRRPAGATEFQITFMIDASDLVSDCKQGENGEYTFRTPSGEMRARIYPPNVADATYSIIKDGGKFSHSLINLGKGSYIYTKSGIIESAEAAWIDADVYYGSTDDGVVNNRGDVWSTVWGAGTGSSANSTDANSMMVYTRNTGSSSYYYYISRFFEAVNTAAIPDDGVISQANFKFNAWKYYSGHEGSTVHIQKGTWSPSLSTSHFSSFSGSTYGSTAVNSDTAAWYSISFNATGKSDISKTGYTYFCFRSGWDYDNSAPGSVMESLIMVKSADTSGTSDDPYLEIVMATPTPTPTSTPTPTPTATPTNTPVPVYYSKDFEGDNRYLVSVEAYLPLAAYGSINVNSASMTLQKLGLAESVITYSTVAGAGDYDPIPHTFSEAGNFLLRGYKEGIEEASAALSVLSFSTPPEIWNRLIGSATAGVHVEDISGTVTTVRKVVTPGMTLHNFSATILGDVTPVLSISGISDSVSEPGLYCFLVEGSNAVLWGTQSDFVHSATEFEGSYIHNWVYEFPQQRPRSKYHLLILYDGGDYWRFALGSFVTDNQSEVQALSSIAQEADLIEPLNAVHDYLMALSVNNSSEITEYDTINAATATVGSASVPIPAWSRAITGASTTIPISGETLESWVMWGYNPLSNRTARSYLLEEIGTLIEDLSLSAAGENQ